MMGVRRSDLRADVGAFLMRASTQRPRAAVDSRHCSSRDLHHRTSQHLNLMAQLQGVSLFLDYERHIGNSRTQYFQFSRT